MATSAPPEGSSQKGLVVPWGWLSLCLLVLSITAVGTLAVVVKRESADTLSTIALALAVLSFSAQLIIALAQAHNGTMQVSQADRVNADTRSSLAEIRATSNALLATQREQFGKVLQAALNSAVPAAVEDVIPKEDDQEVDQDEVDRTSKDLEERLFVRLNEALSPQKTTSQVGDWMASIITKPEPSPLYQRITTFPDKERGLELKKILNTLSPREAALFARNATAIRDQAARGAVNPSTITQRNRETPRGATDHLIDLGLVSATDVRPSSSGNPRRRIQLTDLGVEVASLFLAKGPTPSWLLDAYN